MESVSALPTAWSAPRREAADALGISQSYISRLEKRIIHTLKARLESE